MKPKSTSAASKPFTKAQMAAALENAPETTLTDNATAEADWAEAMVSKSYSELKQGLAKKRMGRPLADKPKVQVAIRFDQDILATFKATGKGWQTRLNDLLRKHLHEIN